MPQNEKLILLPKTAEEMVKSKIIKSKFHRGFTTMKNIIFFLFITTLTFFSYGQTKNVADTNPKKQVRIDKSKASVYISFDRVGQGIPVYDSDSKERVWLKFTNNSIFSVYVGVFHLKHVEDEKLLYYKIEKEDDDLGDKEIPKGYSRGGVGSPDLELKPGKSIGFSVPQNHLSENLKIRIDFSYDWELHIYEAQNSNPRHSVFFSSSDLKKIFK